MKLGGTAGAAVVSLVLFAGAAAAGPDIAGRVIFARGGSLWMTDAKGKGPATVVATLQAPAAGVHTVRTDGTGHTLLVDLDGRWFWAALPEPGQEAKLAELPCAAGPARLTRKGDLVLCATAAGKAVIVRLRDGKTFERDASAAAASFTERADGVRELVWVDGDRVLAAPLARPTETRVVAPAAPLRGFLAAPDGSRGVGVYLDRPRKPKDAPERDQLFGFALDGTAARRRLIRDGVVIDWSWDAQWLLVQDGTKACIARATGGQFKCWKGYTAVSLAADGSYALVLGPRDGAGAAAPAEEKRGGSGESASGEGGEGEHDDTEDAGASEPKGPQSLFRAKLGGPYTERPALVETEVDGAALWLSALPIAP